MAPTTTVTLTYTVNHTEWAAITGAHPDDVPAEIGDAIDSLRRHSVTHPALPAPRFILRETTGPGPTVSVDFAEVAAVLDRYCTRPTPLTPVDLDRKDNR